MFTNTKWQFVLSLARGVHHYAPGIENGKDFLLQLSSQAFDRHLSAAQETACESKRPWIHNNDNDNHCDASRPKLPSSTRKIVDVVIVGAIVVVG